MGNNNISSKDLPQMTSSIGTISDCPEKQLNNFLQHFTRNTGQEVNVMLLEHSYASRSNVNPKNLNARPKKTLLVNEFSSSSLSFENDDTNIDVESVDVPLPPYDINSITLAMKKCEKFTDSLPHDEPVDKEDWETHVDKSGWSRSKTDLYKKMVRALNMDRLARLTCAGSWNESLQRRVIIDKTAKRFRHLFAYYYWERSLIEPIHKTFLKSLNSDYLTIYIDALETLRTKCPELINRVLGSKPVVDLLNLKVMKQVMKKSWGSWDPVMSSLNEQILDKLPGDPIIVMVPPSHMKEEFSSPRVNQWKSYFSALGSVVPIIVQSGSDEKETSPTKLDQLMCATRLKVAQLQLNSPEKRIILVGWKAGSAIAIQVACTARVSAIVCLGFSVFTILGERGYPADILLDLPCPAFFVIGQNSASVSSSINQIPVDEVGDFLSGAFVPLVSQPLKLQMTIDESAKRAHKTTTNNLSSRRTSRKKEKKPKFTTESLSLPLKQSQLVGTSHTKQIPELSSEEKSLFIAHDSMKTSEHKDVVSKRETSTTKDNSLLHYLQLPSKQVVGRNKKIAKSETVTSQTSSAEGHITKSANVHSYNATQMPLTLVNASEAVASKRNQDMKKNVHMQDSMYIPIQSSVSAQENPRVHEENKDLSKSHVITETSADKNVCSVSDSKDPVKPNIFVVPASKIPPSILKGWRQVTKTVTLPNGNTVPGTFVISNSSLSSFQANNLPGQIDIRLLRANQQIDSTKSKGMSKDQQVPIASQIYKGGSEHVSASSKILDHQLAPTQSLGEFALGNSKLENNTSELPIVLTINSNEYLNSTATVTLQDNFSFPLYDKDAENNNELINISSLGTVSNDIMKSKNGKSEMLKKPARDIICGTADCIRKSVGKFPVQKLDQKQGSQKYKKIIIPDKNSFVKINDDNDGNGGSGSVSSSDRDEVIGSNINLKRKIIKKVSFGPENSEKVFYYE
ncbi:Uncharacterized protein GBIM_12208 [Gryllus bimaculatus]|nr:Uncharacterized protein GBIM_12208 [Gryllus bimaculatus]